MTAVEIIHEIKRLPQEEQAQVIEFALATAEERQLSSEELGRLAERMVATTDPSEAYRLQKEIVRGFYRL